MQHDRKPHDGSAAAHPAAVAELPARKAKSFDVCPAIPLAARTAAHLAAAAVNAASSMYARNPREARRAFTSPSALGTLGTASGSFTGGLHSSPHWLVAASKGRYTLSANRHDPTCTPAL